jgi:hypothetical protein
VNDAEAIPFAANCFIKLGAGAEAVIVAMLRECVEAQVLLQETFLRAYR